jgi:hypothetical protein
MGAELCQVHGVQLGQLCCPHVTSAIRGSLEVLPDSAVSANIDLLDDGSKLLPIVVCQSCAARFNIAVNANLPGEAFEREELILAPRCGICFAAWRDGRSGSDA